MNLFKSSPFANIINSFGKWRDQQNFGQTGDYSMHSTDSTDSTYNTDNNDIYIFNIFNDSGIHIDTVYLFVIILSIIYVTISLIAINKVFSKNTEESRKFKIISIISWVISGGSIGWFFILLWMFDVKY